MSKIGLYPSLSNGKRSTNINLMMNFISLCDGYHDVIDIANLIGVPSWDLYKIASDLEKYKIISS